MLAHCVSSPTLMCYTPDLICDKLNDLQQSLDRLSLSNDVDAVSSE
jgi:hypothetical protein